MIKYTIILVLIWTNLSAQSPFDDFNVDNKKTNIHHLEDNIEFKIVNEDKNALISYGVLRENKLYFYDKNENLILLYTLNDKEDKYLSRDPLESQFPQNSPYIFVSADPINKIDPDGNADYYTRDGTHRGNDGKDDNKTMLSSDKPIDADKDWSYFEGAKDLNIGHDVFLGLASAINQETGWNKNKLEALAIGNSIINIANQGAGTLKSLEDLVMYDNTVVNGAEKKFYLDFTKKTNKQQNYKYALTSAINAIGYDNGMSDFKDYSNGADGWDGLDLIYSKNSKGNKMYNSHRNYVWSLDSKQILIQYQNSFGGDINVLKFKYSDDNPVVRATNVHGQTIFQDILTPLGGRFDKINKGRFVP